MNYWVCNYTCFWLKVSINPKVKARCFLWFEYWKFEVLKQIYKTSFFVFKLNNIFFILSVLVLPDFAPLRIIASLAAICLSVKKYGVNRRTFMIPNKTLIQPAAVYMLRVMYPSHRTLPFTPRGVTAACNPVKYFGVTFRKTGPFWLVTWLARLKNNKEIF